MDDRSDDWVVCVLCLIALGGLLGALVLALLKIDAPHALTGVTAAAVGALIAALLLVRVYWSLAKNRERRNSVNANTAKA